MSVLMNLPTSDKTLQRYARVAGVFYLLIFVIYMAGLALNGSLHAGSFAASAQSISSSEVLYRTSLSLMLLASVLTIPLAGALYAFLKPVNANLAMFAVLFRTCEAVLGGVTKMALFARLGIYTGSVAIFSLEQQSALSSLIRVAYQTGFNISVLLFSFGSILFFYLLFTSRFIPRALSAFGLFASASVTAVSLTNLIYPDLLSGNLWWTPMFIAEIATGLWLVVKGIDLSYWKYQTGAAAKATSS